MCPDNPRTSIRAPQIVKELTTLRKFELHEKLQLSVYLTTLTYAACEM